MPIRSFKCGDTQAMFEGRRSRRFVNIETVAMRKLAMLNRASTLDDLRIPPNNRPADLPTSRSSITTEGNRHAQDPLPTSR